MDMKKFLIAQLLIVVIFCSACAINFYKFTQCDFAPSWKVEVVHGGWSGHYSRRRYYYVVRL